jgi:glycosyltransferase involved in cell wall biosynthesis
MVPYKRVEIVVDAFNKLGLPLKVVGGGPMRKKIERKAKRNVEFLGEVPDNELLKLYQRCRALVFAGVEDFGLAPLEAQAAGRPVIAYGCGGFLETVVDGKTGIFFNEQSSSSLIDAVRKFRKMDFDTGLIRSHALQFDTNVFRHKIRDYVEKRYQEWTQKQRGAFSP